MSVYKRKGSPYYYYSFKYKRRTFRASTGTKNREEAEQVEARVKRQLWERHELGVKDPHPWDKALAKFINAKKHLSTLDEYISTFEMLTIAFGKIKPVMNLEDINRELIEDIMDEYQDERECGDARINRMSSQLRSLLNMAADEWNWLEYAPKLRFYKEHKKEPRWLTIKEAQQLIKAAPDHLKDPIRFSLLSGVRKSNCLGLKWSWIMMDSRQIVIPAEVFKTQKIHAIPITDEIKKILLRNMGNHEENVFVYRGKPFGQIDNKDTWKPLLEKAGIKNFRWHDLRHTWASWHVMNGTSLPELMDLAGWSSYSMVKRYAHLDVNHLRKAAGNISIKEGFGQLLEFKK